MEVKTPAGRRSDCSSGAADIKALFSDTDSCSGLKTSGVDIGTPICQNRGQVNTSLQTAQDFFMTEHPKSWWLVPVISGGANCDPTNPTKVVNWAKIYPTEVNTTGNPKYIKANIVCDPTLIDLVIDTSLCFSASVGPRTDQGLLMLYGICAAAVLALVLIPSILLAAALVIVTSVLTPLIEHYFLLGLPGILMSAPARLRR